MITESKGHGNLESDIEMKEHVKIHSDSYEDDGDERQGDESDEDDSDISAERQGDESDEDDSDISAERQGDESDEDDSDIRDDNSRNGDPDYVPLVELSNDDPPDSNGLFVGELSQLRDFITSINSNSACMTPGCKGKLVCTALKRSGLGGAVDMSFACDGCNNRKTTFQSSTRYKTRQALRTEASIQKRSKQKEKSTECLNKLGGSV